ncbi:uracil-DNA glycosylase-like protein [Rhodocollybia butyracea]|uniref:Uracil-DNA glycosylase n=1 Tax=Rhodocollybia butyracea TaxID=206335 RepID=A0A9P5PIU8_9AGAR|nr:uracil-DNA glycosylase-like protein [Rhodocollybia butyracea]
MSDDKVVYFQDLEPAHRSTAVSDTSPVASKALAASSNGNASKTTVTAVKRQRTLADMFSGPSSKRQKSTPDSSPSRSQSAFVSGVQKLNSIPFSLKEYKDSLNEEQAKHLRLECEVMGKSCAFLWEQGVRGADDTPQPLKVYPSPRDIYAWSNFTPLGKVKVVIIGQDPYPGPNQAHGLCFSVRMGVPIPPSLSNIYAEIKSEFPEFVPPRHGHLAAWANAVQARQANSHADKGWERFTQKVIDIVDKYGGASIKSSASGEASGVGRGVVFLAWGAFAQKRVAQLNKTKHLILKSAHPSPRSADRGFLGNGHFKAANDWLAERYGTDGPVDWCALDTDNQT